MDISRITSMVLTEDRLDATYYGTRYLKNALFLKKCGLPFAPIGTLTEKCNCGATPKQVVYDGTGTGLVRTTDVRPNVFLAEGVLRTSELRVSADASVAAVPGDLLYTMSGTIGYAAVVQEGVDVVSFSNTIARARFSARSGQDSRFTAAFFNCKYGYTQSLRLVSGGIQGHVMPNPFKRLSVPTPHVDAQRYVGNKVRAAEQLRDRARQFLGDVRQHHANLIPPFRPTREKWNTFRLTSGAVADVIVPHFYPPAVTEYLAGLHSKSLSQLCETVYSGETYEPDDQGVDQATSRSCNGRFLRRPCNRVRPPSRTDLDLQPHDLLLTNAAHDKGYIGTDVTYFHGGPRNIPSAKVMVLRPNRTIVPASYVFAYLQTRVGYLQIQSAIRGISAGIRAQDVAAIRIPLPAVTEQDRADWLATDTQVADAGAAEETARLLCAAATQLVERLVEGRVHEADLVAAQQALDAGDRGPDREILMSLGQDGETDTEPLFEDVDALYAFLDASEEKSA